MAVDPDAVDAMARLVADIYREAETALLRLTARQINNGLARNRLEDVQALRRGAQSIVERLDIDSGVAVREQLAAAYRHGWGNAVADLPERWTPASGIGQAAREAAKQRSGTAFVEALASALVRDVGVASSNILRNVEDAYKRVQAAASARILTGAQTRREAAQAMWQGLVERGLTSFTDKSGRRWRLSSYVEMATRTNAQRAATQGQVDRLDAIDVHFVYVSDSPQECKTCRPFEGKILRTDDGPLTVQVEHATQDGKMVTVKALDTLNGARSKGLFHPNCRHSVSAYLPGVSKPPKAKPDPEGEQARQKQRALERKIRYAKEQEQAALTEDAKKAAAKKTRTAQAQLRQHLADNPKLKRLRYREQPGAGNIPPKGQTPDAAGELDGGTPPGPTPPPRRTDPDPKPDPKPPVPDPKPTPPPPPVKPKAEPKPKPKPARLVSDDTRAAIDQARQSLPTSREGWLNDRREQTGSGYRYTYRKDPNGRLLPPEAYERHLDAVLDVGRRLRQDLDRIMSQDKELTDARKVFDAIDMDLAWPADVIKARNAVKRREAHLVRQLLADVRRMGGKIEAKTDDQGLHVGYNNPEITTAPSGWQDLIAEALPNLPTDWLEKMKGKPLHIIGTRRAFYHASHNGRPDVLALRNNGAKYNGSFSTGDAEIALHELGHRMEQYVPGLKELEYAMVRRRSTRGGVLDAPTPIGGAHAASEVSYQDSWSHAYAGKTYEANSPDDPAAVASELFQTALQDLFGRSPNVFTGQDGIDFALGVLAALG